MRSLRSNLRTGAVALFVAMAVVAAPAFGVRNATTITTQQRCKPGAVLAFANVDPGSLTTSYGTAGVRPRFNCADSRNRVLAKKVDVGVYYVAFPGISNASTTAGDLVASVSVSNAGGRTIGYFQINDPPRGHVLEVDIIRTDTNMLDDDAFSVALFGFRHT